MINHIVPVQRLDGSELTPQDHRTIEQLTHTGGLQHIGDGNELGVKIDHTEFERTRTALAEIGIKLDPDRGEAVADCQDIFDPEFE